MPNLMYMTTFSDMKSHDDHWSAFGKTDEWQKLLRMDEYKNTVSKAIHTCFIRHRIRIFNVSSLYVLTSSSAPSPRREGEQKITFLLSPSPLERDLGRGQPGILILAIASSTSMLVIS